MTISIIFIDQDSQGEICDGCNEVIKGKAYVMFLDFGDPTTTTPLDTVYCVICKTNFIKGEDE